MSSENEHHGWNKKYMDEDKWKLNMAKVRTWGWVLNDNDFIGWRSDVGFSLAKPEHRGSKIFTQKQIQELEDNGYIPRSRGARRGFKYFCKRYGIPTEVDKRAMEGGTAKEIASVANRSTSAEVTESDPRMVDVVNAGGNESDDASRNGMDITAEDGDNGQNEKTEPQTTADPSPPVVDASFATGVEATVPDTRIVDADIAAEDGGNGRDEKKKGAMSPKKDSEESGTATMPVSTNDTSKVAALLASRSATNDTPAPKPVKPAPGTLSGTEGGTVAALFAARAADTDKAVKSKPGKLSDVGKGGVAALFSARAAGIEAVTGKPKAVKLSDSGKNVLHSATPAVSLSTPVSTAAKKIEKKEEENKAATQLSLNKDPEFAKYFKMLSVGIPMGAVQQVMSRDGTDPSILDGDHDKPYMPKPTPTVTERPPLRDDPKFAKYFKMLSVGLPMGAVKQAMTRDGCDPSVMDMDHDMPLATPDHKEDGTASATAAKKKKSPKVLRKKIFWTSIDKSKLDKDSLWAQAPQESRNLEGLDYDEKKFATLFTQQNGKKGTGGKSSASGAQKGKKKALVHLIDGRREMNGSIVLRKFKHNYKQLARDLDNLDVGNMDENEVKAHMKLLPTKDEVKKIDAYLAKANSESEKQEAIAKLGDCEKYMVAMMSVDEAGKKFGCMLYRSQFEGRVAELEAEVKDLTEACACVRGSERLRKLLVYALRLGNTLNTTESGEDASAITLDSLLKMHEAKAFDKQTSVLHYLVSIIEKNDKDVLRVKEDLEPAKKAERIVAESLRKSLADLSDGLGAINDMGMEEAQRQAEAKGDGNVLADVNAVLKQTNIGQFALSADTRLKELYGELDDAFEACSGLLKYFGEDAVMPSDVFFSTLTRFIALFGKALEDHQRREKARVRQEKLAEKQERDGGVPTHHSESSPADKILQELSSGNALDKLKPVGFRQSSLRDLVKGEEDARKAKPPKSQHKSAGGDGARSRAPARYQREGKSDST